jgi:hypothetical protein
MFIMTKDEAIHKALKVLNCLNNDRVYETAWVKGAINACEEALEQPAQEPVAWIKKIELSYMKGNLATGVCIWKTNLGLIPEPDDVPLYTHPHQWQGLTDDVVASIWMHEAVPMNGQDFKRVYHAIEQALKEKNHD